jgi:hypothetical protein
MHATCANFGVGASIHESFVTKPIAIETGQPSPRSHVPAKINSKFFEFRSRLSDLKRRLRALKISDYFNLLLKLIYDTRVACIRVKR